MSTYLSNSSAFETAVSRGVTSVRSAKLTQLVSAVKLYVSRPTAEHIRDVQAKFTAWRNGDPMEFYNRGTAIADDFNAEVKDALETFGLGPPPTFHGDPDDPDAEDQEERKEHLPPAPAVAANRWRKLKKAGTTGMGAASAGISIAQRVTGTGPTALIAGAAAATSATGIGLIAVGGGLQIAASTQAVRSAAKTHDHLKNLMDLYNRRKDSELQHCVAVTSTKKEGLSGTSNDLPNLDGAGHDLVANHVLSYIIHKKGAKRRRKLISAIPVIGMIEVGRAVLKKRYKLEEGTLGKHRERAAKWLAVHFLQCDCVLSQSIVAELYSDEEMKLLREEEYEEVTKYLVRKISST